MEEIVDSKEWSIAFRESMKAAKRVAWVAERLIKTVEDRDHIGFACMTNRLRKLVDSMATNGQAYTSWAMTELGPQATLLAIIQLSSETSAERQRELVIEELVNLDEEEWQGERSKCCDEPDCDNHLVLAEASKERERRAAPH
jgi:hypothetical protein